MRKAFLMLAGTLALSGCNALTDACSTIQSEGITIDVRDSVTNVLLKNDSTSSLIYRVNGGPLLSSSIIYPDRLAIFGSGTFDLTLNRPGYQPWTKNGVVVGTTTIGSCAQPTRLSLTARLVAK